LLHLQRPGRDEFVAFGLGGVEGGFGFGEVGLERRLVEFRQRLASLERLPLLDEELLDAAANLDRADLNLMRGSDYALDAECQLAGLGLRVVRRPAGPLKFAALRRRRCFAG